MQKTILITGSTDGIGLATAQMLVPMGHRVLLHGRNPEKLAGVEQSLSTLSDGETVETYVADLSRLRDVDSLASAITNRHDKLDVLINNAGILKTPDPVTPEGFDVRFAVNTLAPYLLTQRLLPLMNSTGRVVNVSSAGQSPVDINALLGKVTIADDFVAYTQSKLAIIMWSRAMAESLRGSGPSIIAVNPGSLLGSKMVQEGFGIAGGDIGKGADILCRAALSDEFAEASGLYFDNDSGNFASPHSDALDRHKSGDVVHAIERIIANSGT